jgi:hypothetical protein
MGWITRKNASIDPGSLVAGEAVIDPKPTC